MLLPDSGRLLVRVQPAPTWRTDFEGTALVAEPHHLLLMLAGLQLRLTDCRCDDCLPVLAVPLVAPADLTAYLVANVEVHEVARGGRAREPKCGHPLAAVEQAERGSRAGQGARKAEEAPGPGPRGNVVVTGVGRRPGPAP